MAVQPFKDRVTSADVDAPVSDRHSVATPLLDFMDPSLRRLIRDCGWAELSEVQRIGAVYEFVRIRDRVRLQHQPRSSRS
jgi:hypothetical protein